MGERTGGRPPSLTAWTVWGVGMVTYIFAVLQRTSLGVVGTQAAQHFGTSVGIVSTFVVVQLATYALMQIPAGILLDRFGSRAMLVAGSLVMSAGQIAVALTDEFCVALAGRIVLGAGDACIFTGILRLLPFWFTPARVPIITQMTGMLGQLGQVAAVATVLPLVSFVGWRPTFLASAALCVVMALCCLVAVRDAPPGKERSLTAGRLSEIPQQVTQVLKHPATQLGFWIHLTSGFSLNAFMLMWGIPYLSIGQGRSPLEAGVLFSLAAITGAVVGPVIGWLTGRHPLRRSNLALSVIFSTLAMWSAVLLWPGPAPLWLLTMLVVTMAAGGPATGIGVDYARTQLPSNRLGAGNGMVISGAFLGATVMILVIGIFLEATSNGAAYTAGQLRWAMSLQLPVFAVGLTGIFISRRRMRDRLEAEGVTVPRWQEVLERYRRR